MLISFTKGKNTKIGELFERLAKVEEANKELTKTVGVLEGVTFKVRALPYIEETVLDYIRFYIKQSGGSPTLQQLAYLLPDQSKNTARNMILRLEDHGYVTREVGKHRSIKLTNKPY